MQWVWDVQKTKHDDHQQKQNFKVVSRPFYETLQYERPKSIVSKESGWKSQCKKKGEGAQKEKKKKITSYTESTRHLPHTGRLYYKWLTFWRRKKRFKCITCKSRYFLKILFISDFDDDFAPDFGSCHRCGWNKVGLNNVTESAASFEAVDVEFNEEKDVPTFLHVAAMSAGKLLWAKHFESEFRQWIKNRHRNRRHKFF